MGVKTPNLLTRSNIFGSTALALGRRCTTEGDRLRPTHEGWPAVGASVDRAQPWENTNTLGLAELLGEVSACHLPNGPAVAIQNK